MLRNLFKLMFPVMYMAEGDGDGGGDDDPWSTNLPESVQEWDEVKNSDTPEKFWDQMVNMRSFLGQSIRIPGEGASTEDQTAFHEKILSKVPGLIYTPDYENEEATGKFYNALGRPEETEGYKAPEVDAKGVALNDAPVKAFMPIAHKHGLSQRQFEGIVADMTSMNVESAIVDAAKIQEQATLLKNEWGMAFDGNMVRIGNVIKNTGAPVALQEAIAAGRVDPSTAKWLLGIANSFKGEGSNLIDDKSQDGILSPKQARTEISEILNNKEHSYWHPERPDHKDAKDHLRRLYLMADPEPATGQSGSVGVGGAVDFK